MTRPLISRRGHRPVLRICATTGAGVILAFGVASMSAVGHAAVKVKPPCLARELTGHAGFQGATGSMLGGITVTNRSAAACTLPRTPAVALFWHRWPLRVAITAFPTGWLARMNSQWATPVITLRPGGHAEVILQWFNWCGARPWGRHRGIALTVRLRLDRQHPPVNATTPELVLPPYCNQKSASGTGSTLRVSPYVR